MSVFVCSLNSGSNGNCYYIGNENDAVLIDAGISCREIERRMRLRGLSTDNLRALFISHEHTDHISGVRVFSKKYKIPVYITEQTLIHSALNIHPSLVNSFSPALPVRIGSLQISAFAKLHDACDPHSFVIDSNGVTVGVFTDIGRACDNVVSHFKRCHAAFLEANYDEDMLANGRYPYHLKRRIRGGHGHLSNREALDLCLRHRPVFLSHLILTHLSQENNCPTLVHELFSQHLQGVKVTVASRYEPSEVFTIAHPHPATSLPKAQQLSLFG